MQKIRSKSILSITLFTPMFLLLFSMAYGTECTGLAQVQEKRKENNCLVPFFKDCSIIHNPTEKEKEDKIVMALKQMVKNQVITEEDVLYLVLHCEYSCIELLEEENSKCYSIEKTQDILKILNSETNSKKHIWIIIASSLAGYVKSIPKNSKLLDFFQTVCAERNVVLEYMGNGQYSELLEESHSNITRYTIRLRKFAILCKYFKLYEEEGRWSLILYNALLYENKFTNLIKYITNIFINSWPNFNKALIVKDIPNDRPIAMTENEKKIIQLIRTCAKPVYSIILNHLNGLKNGTLHKSATLHEPQSDISQSNSFRLFQLVFIFSGFICNSESSFPLPTIIDIASTQNYGIYAEVIDEDIIVLSITSNCISGQTEFPFCLWKHFNVECLISLLKQPNYCFLIRDADYDIFYFELWKKKTIELLPFNFSALPKNTDTLVLADLLEHNSFSIVNEKLENILPNTNISSTVHYIQQHIAITEGISKNKIVTVYGTTKSVDIVISKDKISLKPNHPVEKNASTEEKRKLESITQDENNSPPEKRMELNFHNNATNSTNTSIIDSTVDNKEAGHLKSCLDNSRTIPPHPNPCSDPDFESNITLDPDFKLDSKIDLTQYLESCFDLNFDFDFLS
ncbi:hypothetical protein NEFER03_1947 [Nematocida sp. LUAm3]|nr:hypothetical protein NEFER03_1947 [Nematocida sp. LUAm3]